MLVQAEIPDCNPINFIIKYKCSEDRQVTQFLTRVNRLLTGITDYRTIPYTVSYVASASDQRTIYYIEVISNTSELNELA